MGAQWRNRVVQKVLAKTRVLQATVSVLGNRESEPFCSIELGEKPGYVYFLAFIIKTFAGCAPQRYWSFYGISKPVLAMLSNVLN